MPEVKCEIFVIRDVIRESSQEPVEKITCEICYDEFEKKKAGE